MNRKLYPLKFNPVFLEKVWGSETWTVSSMGEGLEGEVSDGYLAGNTLSDLIEIYMGELVGDNVFEFHNLQMPVLIKQLKVEDRISVQVHPDDVIAAERYGDYGKEECWYVVDADQSARVYAGFRKDTDAGEFYAACKNGTVIDLLNCFAPKPGDFFHIKPGTVHSCSGNLTIAEVQEPSDITLRLYDWGKENNPETARRMDLEEALDIINYSAYDTALFRKSDNGSDAVLTENGHFTVKIIHPAMEEKFEGGESFMVYICLKGDAAVTDEVGNTCRISAGEAVVIPASIDSHILTPGKKGTSLLCVTPAAEEEKDNYINGDEHKN